MARAIIAMSAAASMLIVVLSTIRIIATVIVSRAPIVVKILRLVSFDLGEVARRHNDYEHEKDEDDHDVQAQLAAVLDLNGNTATVGAFSAETLRLTLALVEVLLHPLLANRDTPSAVAK